MKAALTAFLLVLTISSFSQRRKQTPGYGSITPQFGFYSGGYTAGGAVNVGERIGKLAGLGLGVEVLKFKDIKSVYVPVYADFRYFFAPSKGSQVFFTAQPGYGFYNQSESHSVPVPGGGSVSYNIENKGGFYFGTGLGVRGTGKVAPLISVRYTSYDFNTKISGSINEKTNDRTGAVTVNFGIAF